MVYKVQDFKFLSNLPIFHSSICWFNNESFVFLSFFSVLYNIALKCSITDTVRMSSKLREVLHFNVITLMWSYDEEKKNHGAFFFIPLTNCYYYYYYYYYLFNYTILWSTYIQVHIL